MLDIIKTIIYTVAILVVLYVLFFTGLIAFIIVLALIGFSVIYTYINIKEYFNSKK